MPTLARGPVVHLDARDLLGATRYAPLLSGAVATAAVRSAEREPRRTAAAMAVLARSRNPRILAKNLTVAPKALWLAQLARKLETDHIHAHWGAASATLAMLASAVSGVPWSLTVHRWDIREDNLLAAKADSATFLRAISEDGLRDLRRVAGPATDDAFVLHMGVELPDLPKPRPRGEDGPLRVLVPANLLEVKGHRHLVHALALLRDRGVPVAAGLAGQGPLRAELEAQVARLGLLEQCALLGQISHEELLSQYAARRWDAVVLPSVATASGEKEGIPVSLLEAMARDVPVVGTDTGGVPELLGDGSGLLVPPADPLALADAIERLASDGLLRETLGRRGRQRVERDFSIVAVVRELGKRFGAAVTGQ